MPLKFLFLTLSFIFLSYQFDCQTVFGPKKFTEFDYGNVNIIFSVPHNGLKWPDLMPNRTDPLNNYKSDTNTRNFAQALRAELADLFLSRQGKKYRAFIVYNNLHRIKMDPNRDVDYCCADKNAFDAYNSYNDMIQTLFRKNFLINGEGNKYTQALLVDIHGHTHPENLIELGYTVPAVAFSKRTPLEHSNSIQALHHSSKQSLENLLRGPKSLGFFLSKYGLKVTPSIEYPNPYGTEYYSGGYTIVKHSYLSDPTTNINCIQSELPIPIRNGYAIMAKKYALGLYDFYMTFFSA